MQALQIGAHLGCDLIAHVAIFLERLVENALELGWSGWIQGDRRSRSVVQDVVENDGAGRPGKRMLSGNHLVEHRAERKQIAARIQLFAARLFRRHVRDGANDGAGAGLYLRASAARASRRKRSSDVASLAVSAGRNFRATRRPSLVSSAS